jgi:hypothetical protein
MKKSKTTLGDNNYSLFGDTRVHNGTDFQKVQGVPSSENSTLHNKSANSKYDIKVT